MKYSVIDISSSSLSVVVASVNADRAEIVFKEREAVSLVHYLEDHRLTERGMDKLVEVLRNLRETCKNLGAERCYLISTAALRRVENSEEIAARVLRETGLPINFIDGATEAYCDYVANIYYATCDRPVLIDLGGKSIEICDLSKSAKEEMQCFSFGLLDLYRKFIRNIHPDEREAKEMRAFLKDKFDRAGLPGEGVYSTAIMVGAANAAMYEIYAEFADASDEDGRTIKYKKFKKLVKYLLSDEDRSRLILNNAPEKLYLIGSAAIVLKLLFKRFGVDHILVSDRGVKEGYLQLVLEGRECGLYYDFTSDGVGGSERVWPEPAGAPAGGKKKKKTVEKRTTEKKKAGRKASAKEKPFAQADLALSAPEAAEAPAVEQLAEQSAAEPAPKRRGRPKKAVEAPAVEQLAEQSAAEPAPKRRGRPKKAAEAPAVEQPAEQSAAEPVTEPQA